MFAVRIRPVSIYPLQMALKGAALRKFLEEVKQWPNLKHSQDLKHFLTTDR